EAMPATDQRRAMFLEVVELPIQHRDDGGVLVRDRLVARLEVDDAKPGRTQSCTAVDVVSRRVGTPVSQRRDHARDDVAIRLFAGRSYETDDPTHRRQVLGAEVTTGVG